MAGCLHSHDEDVNPLAQEGARHHIIHLRARHCVDLESDCDVTVASFQYAEYAPVEDLHKWIAVDVVAVTDHMKDLTRSRRELAAGRHMTTVVVGRRMMVDARPYRKIAAGWFRS